ncbi:MAG TPA: TIGR03089 family protein [Candidatus Janibacter merdipullorum]|nr:TIGR03089 family protein [Candidatus Janibacter merdipullorum]
MPTPPEVLTALNARDSAAPRITCYDDEPGPTAGERVELSGRVLGTWVSKAGNALQEEWDVEPDDVVRLALRPHWRLLYWAWAAWSVGAHVDLDGSRTAALVVTDDVAHLSDDVPGVLVTRGALARSAGHSLPEGVMDEAADLASFGDDFDPWQEPEDTSPALTVDGTTTSYAEVVAEADAAVDPAPGARLQLVDPSAAEILRAALAVWARDGSLVVHLGAVDADALARRAASEGVTAG